MSRRLILGTLVVAVASSTGCAQVIGIEDTKFEAPIVSKPGENYQCVGKGPTRPSLPTEIDITINIFEASGGTGILAGLTLKACPRTTDTTCATPLATAKSDDKGVVTFKVKTEVRVDGFPGYIEIPPQILAPKDKDNKVIATKAPDRMPYLLVFGEPPNKSGTYPLSSFTQEDFIASFLTANGLTYKETEAHVAINAADCADKDAPNIRFDLGTPVHSGPNTRPIYFTKDFAVTTPPALSQTLSNGLGGFVNLQTVGVPALAQFTAKYAPTGATVSKTTVPLKAGYLTTFRLQPTE